MGFFKMLETSGPFTAPLCFAMALAIVWIVKRWMAAETEVKDLLKENAETAKESAKDYAQYGEVMRGTIKDNTGALSTFNQQAAGVLAARG